MSRYKKILFVSKYYYPHLGGVEKHIDHISEVIQETGRFKITLITERYQNQLASFEKIGDIGIHRISYKHIKVIGLFLLWVELLKKINLFYESDIIHVHDVFIWILPIRIILFWKKIYMTFHGWEGKYPVPLTSLLQKRLAYLTTSANICIGKYLEQLYGIQATVIKYGSTALNSEYKSLRKTPKIIYIGRLEKDTGLPELIKSLRFTGKKAIFYGDGSLRDDCKSVGVVKGIVKDVSSVISDCDICFAGGYLTMLDAMASSKPTVIIADSYVRKMAFVNEDFSKLITICFSEKQISKYLKQFPKKKNKIKMAHLWAIAQTWENMGETYMSLWNA